MDTELIKKYLEMFKISLIIVAIALVTAIFLLVKIIPSTITYFENKSKLTQSEQKLETKKSELETAKKNKARQEAMEREGIEVKAIFRDINKTGNSTADIIAGEIKEINDLIKYYGIKTYRVNYNYDSPDDLFYKNKKESFGVCEMNMELFATYMKFQSFLKDLYKHEHFLNMQAIEIVPYKKDKSILNIKMKISLYAEKDANADENREVPPTSDDELTDDFVL